MFKSSVNVKKLNDIIKNTIDAIDKSRNEIFDIAENARSECRTLEYELEQIKQRVVEVIDQVDTLEILEKKSRQRLIMVSKDFKQFTERDIQAAYEEAKNLQVEISLRRQLEKDLIKQRSDLERRLKNALEVVKKAENLVSQVGMAMGYLNGSLVEVFDHLENIQQRQSLGIQVIKAQEEERQRIAREIHDGPAQIMANIVLKAEICERLMDKDIEKTKFELNQLKNIVRDCLKDVRKIIYDLRPMSLDDLGLIPTIQRFIINFEEETGVNVNFSVVSKKDNIDTAIQLTLFRILQESLNNVRKHAAASNVVIKLEMMADGITMLIIDDGKGFDVEEKMSKEQGGECFGLYSMRERVELLKGNIDINSGLNMGTRIKVSIPVVDEEE
ncbi:MAG: sensor histidine kinase [Bacillota bacterium]